MTRGDALVPLGVVTGAHGVRGELRVKPYNPSSDLLLELESVTLRAQGAPDGRTAAVQSARRHGDGLLIVLEGCTDRDAAQALRGSELCVRRRELPPPGEGEFYLIDLIGLEVRGADGTPLGTVVEAIEYPASQVLRVAGAAGAIEVPILDRYLLEVRLDEGLVIVDHVDELDVEPPAGTAQSARRAEE